MLVGWRVLHPDLLLGFTAQRVTAPSSVSLSKTPLVLVVKGQPPAVALLRAHE
jgi:hypothetical protein